MSLPTEAQNESFEVLFSSCQQHAKQAGYTFIEQKLKTQNSGLILYIACKYSAKSESKYTDNVQKNTHDISIFPSNLLVKTDNMI